MELRLDNSSARSFIVRMSYTRKVAGIVLVFGWIAVGSAMAANTQWEIEPKKDTRFRVGKLSVVGGSTGPQGVRFMLKNLSIQSPIQFTVAAADVSNPVEVSVYKDKPEQALLQGSIRGTGVVTFKFRTDESIKLMVKGAAGSKYQVATWVGPQIPQAAPATLVSKKEFLAPSSGATHAAVTTPTPAVPVGAAAPAPAGGGSTNSILLGLIFLALVVIAVLLFRGQRKGTNLLLLLVALALVPAWGDRRDAGTVVDPDAPELVTEQNEMERISHALHELHDRLDKIDASGTAFEDPVNAVKILIPFLEEFGLIDPREAAVQADYNPSGMPSLPTQYLDDPTASPAKSACFTSAMSDIQKARRHLENNYVVFRQTELKTGRIYELADAATGLSPYAKLLWTVQKSDPNEAMNKAKEGFYSKYDEGQQSGLKFLNDALKQIGQCEREHYGNASWYEMYGYPYFTFMSERYTRKP